MASQVTAILLLILGQEGQQPFLWLGQFALWVVLITALVSALDYYWAFATATTDTIPQAGERPADPERRKAV